MKLLFFTPNYLPGSRYGGPVQSVHGLAKALVGLGHEVTVLTSDLDGFERLDVPLDRASEIDGVRVHYCPVVPPRRLYVSPALARLSRLLVPQMDAVHVNGAFLWPGPHLAREARWADVPLVMSPRGMLIPELVAGKSRWLKLAWIRLQERAALASASVLHVTAVNEAEGLRTMGLDLAPIAVLGNGIASPEPPTADEVDAHWAEVPRGRRVAYLGRLGWNKGVDMAIAAVRACPDATIFIAGHDEIGLRAQLEPQLTRPDGSVCGRFLGHLDGRRKWAFLAGADILLMPSLQENFGNVLIEALAIGTSVIATEGVGAASYLRRIDPGLVITRDQGTLTQTLAALLGDPDRCARVARAGKTLVESELHWAGIAAKMSALYRGEPP